MNSVKQWLARVFLGLLVVGGGLGVSSLFHSQSNAYTDSQATFLPGDVKINGDVKLVGNDVLDSDGTTRITVGSSITLTGTVTPSVFLVPTADITAATPTVTGQMIRTAAGVVYIATQTANTGGWQKVGSQ